MNNIFKFLGSTAGRWVRMIAGIGIILIGVYAVSGVWRWVLIIIGLIPFLAGLFDFCVFAPLLKLPFNGRELRQLFS